MKAYDLVDTICRDRFSFTIGQEIGYGAQGQVFSIKERPNEVIKISILYDVDPVKDIDEVFGTIALVYDYIVKYAPRTFVRIYEFDRLDTGSRATVNGRQSYIIYYSIQEKLQQLSDDEKKVFKTICQAMNNELDSDRTVPEIIEELSSWFQFDSKKIIQFYKDILVAPINNNDFHRRNIMKDADGNFKIIDFDLAELT